MSFGVGVGDMLAMSRLAMDIYKTCKYASKSFQAVAGEVMSLRLVLEELDETLRQDGVRLGARREARLCALLANAHNALHELRGELDKFASLTTDRQRKYDVLQWGFKDVGEIRLRIVSTVTSLNAMGGLLARLEHRQLQKIIVKYFGEVRSRQAENCDRSILTTGTAESIGREENWASLKAELGEAAGLQDEVLEEKHEFITEVLQEAIARGDLDEGDAQLARSLTAASATTTTSTTTSTTKSPASSSLSSTVPTVVVVPSSFASIASSSSHTAAAASATVSITTAAAATTTQLQRWDTESTLIDEAYTERRRRTDPASRTAAAAEDLLAHHTRAGRGASRTNGRVGALALQALGLASDERLLEAADEGDMGAVVRLVRRGADVNAQDKWQWTPLHMAAYGGFDKIAELFILHGAVLAARTVDGETPLMLAERNGHVAVVRTIGEEVERRQRASELAAERGGLRRESEPTLSTGKGKGMFRGKGKVDEEMD
jgi:hypothetical protein